jgi:hypothetical protein
MTRTLYFGGLLAVGLALWWMASHQWMGVSTSKEELFKVGIQVFVFGLAGGGLKLLLDHQSEQRAFRAAMLERLGQAHKSVYRIRRVIAASASSEDHSRLLGELMDVRQDLGTVYHVVRVWRLGRKVAALQRHTNQMRQYLEAVIESALTPAGDPRRLAFDEFLNWREPGGAYQTRFKVPYVSAKKIVDSSFTPN